MISVKDGRGGRDVGKYRGGKLTHTGDGSSVPEI